MLNATRGAVFFGTEESSPFRRWDEETLSQLVSDIEWFDDSRTSSRPPAAPIIVGCFEDASTPTPTQDCASADLQCLSEEYGSSFKLKSSGTAAGAIAVREESSSIEADF